MCAFKVIIMLVLDLGFVLMFVNCSNFVTLSRSASGVKQNLCKMRNWEFKSKKSYGSDLVDQSYITKIIRVKFKIL